MAEDASKEQAKRDRSPSFPYISLAKALERIQTLFEKAKRHEVRVADVAKDWGLAAKSSSTDRNVAALLAYGLIDDSGSGDAKKIKISETGWRILDDKRPGVREKLLAEAALKPRIIADYAQHWKDGRPDEAHSLSQLKFEGGFTDEGARMFLRVFDETIRFTAATPSDKVTATEPENDKPQVRAKEGDFVQWTSAGIDQFKSPVRVIGISDDGQWIWVDGSTTGVPMAEVQVVEKSSGSTAQPPTAPASVLAALNAAKPPGIREEKFALAEGDVVISFPQGLSTDSVDDLAAYIEVFLKKARREAAAKKEGQSH